ncbi:MAG: hypothetical protein PF489_13700 [Salinivirgaceae bacterium]|jgi:2-oxoglutarate dehydrogenase E2 component (dihydrolipoamide succinyltransferase)|nr:hypothetical protein [Salinivirgaceae bacterium]
MIIEIKVPTPGESITEVEIASWLVEDGSIVAKDQEIAEIESDKATLMLSAEEGGQITIKAPEGESIKVGSVACTIDTDKAGEAPTAKTKNKGSSEDKATETVQKESTPKQETKQPTEKKEAKPKSDATEKVRTTPIAEKIMGANNVSVDEIMQGLRRLDKNAVTKGLEGLTATPEYARESERKKMSSLRRKVSERLVAV